MVAKHWGEDRPPSLTPLYGEYDLNLLAESATGSASVVKIMRVGCQPEDIGFQTSMMQRLQSVQGVPVPDILPTAQGTLVAHASDEQGRKRLIWRLALLSGRERPKWVLQNRIRIRAGRQGRFPFRLGAIFPNLSPLETEANAGMSTRG